jgi:hypothetical protein
MDGARPEREMTTRMLRARTGSEEAHVMVCVLLLPGRMSTNAACAGGSAALESWRPGFG